MAKAKITDFTTPMGVKGNLFDLKNLWGMILGTIIFMFVLATGQNMASRLSTRVPALDTKPDYPFSPQVSQTVMRKEVI